MRVGLLILLCYFFSLNAKEFLYPVGYHPERDTVFVIYQKTSTHLELWEWDMRTRYANQLLLSRYSPAGFTFLPDYSGFSFIDNGILKVKSFLKRSPRTIVFDAPIYNVEQVTWIDSKTCYAAGKYQDYFGIFQVDWDGCVQPILFHEGVDYQYPQKIDQLLFFIERTEKGWYRIASTEYRVGSSQEDAFDNRISLYVKNEPVIKEVAQFGTKPLAFLRMISASEGFVISHPKEVSKNDLSIYFDYYHIVYNNGHYDTSLLFSFTIPTPLLLMGSDRLYESLLPLLPYICESGVYYVDLDESFLALHFFEFSTQAKRLVAQADQHIFGVKYCRDAIVYGGEMKGCVGMVEGVWMRLGGID